MHYCLSGAFCYAWENTKEIKQMKEGKGKPVTASVNMKSLDESRNAAYSSCVVVLLEPLLSNN